ncbi:MAG: phospholipid-binding protein MlaC [Acidobacteriota bacterium]
MRRTSPRRPSGRDAPRRPTAPWALALATLLSPSAARAVEDPLDVIRASNQEMLNLYAADKGKADPRVDRMAFEVMDRVTSFSQIAAAAIDGFCDDPQGAQCVEFKNVFIKLLRTSAVRKLGRYRADRFDYLPEKVGQTTAVVPTVAYYDDDEIELDYHLRLLEGHWVIVNYIVDGVDTIRNYRKQFSRMLKRGSMDSVIRRLRKRIRELEEESE